MLLNDLCTSTLTHTSQFLSNFAARQNSFQSHNIIEYLGRRDKEILREEITALVLL